MLNICLLLYITFSSVFVYDNTANGFYIVQYISPMNILIILWILWSNTIESDQIYYKALAEYWQEIS